MNQKKLKELAESANAIKIGGKGTARRKKKIIHRPANVDDKKLQSSLKKLAANNIPGIEEVNLFKDNGEVIHFANPKVQASLSSNTFAISGASDTKSLQDMLPTIMSQMGMSADAGLASELGRRKLGSHGEQQQPGDGQTGTTNEQEGDDEVPVAIITETDQFNTNKNNTNNNNSFSNPPEDQVLNEHLKIIITIGCISVGIMVIVVVAYLIKTYFSYKTINIPNVNEHTVPLKT
ncbi:unnamed protein product [Rotaria sordida]|nr:unnamed protein product [Rotaria sordida]